MGQLHGVETIEIQSGAVAVTTIKTAVIGLVGTAPDAAPAVSATAQSGSVIMGSALRFVAKEPGRVGNGISVQAMAGEPACDLTVTPTEPGGLAITFDPDAPPTSDDLAQAINDEDISPVTAISLANGEPGEIDAFSVVLAGGQDEPYPLNVPVVVLGGTTQAKKMGSAGTLPAAAQDIFDQDGALLIVVRVAESQTDVTQRAAVLNGITTLGSSSAEVGYTPRILIATEFSEDDAVGKALETLANKLRAVAYIDCASMATIQEVAQRRQMYGARVEILRPRVAVATADGQIAYRPYSGRAAGLRARIDREKGWWWSKSNQAVMNIMGLEQIDSFALNDENCEANLLNQEEVSTIIRSDGYRHWGNRLCSTHPQMRFESVRRTADVIEDSIEQTMMLFVDMPIDKNLAVDIIGTINSYMRKLKGMGAIYGGNAWLNTELNTPEAMAAGELWIDYDFGPKSPMEKLTLSVNINNGYLQQEFAQ